jgi:hypothetical protein
MARIAAFTLGGGLALLMSVPRNAGAAATVEYASASVALADAAGGQTSGMVAPGTPVTVVGESTGIEHVQIVGWSADGSDAVIVSAPAVRIVYVTGLVAGKAGRTVLSSREAASTTWHQVQIDGWLPATALTPDVATVWAAAKTLFDQRCSTCHALPAPASIAVNAWPGTVASMAVNAGLTAAQTALISSYLQSQALQAAR